jgi:dTDP-4-dehydrorhamnose 3,5-epimerase
MLAMIDGVTVDPRHQVVNAKGRVVEVLRVDDPTFRHFGQVHLVETRPGVIRAWFRHRLQWDQVAPVTGRTRLVMFDDREDSATRGGVVDVVLDAATPTFVTLPPMVWHGFKTLDDVPAILVQHNTQAFVHAQPDEERRAWDDPAFPVAW